jgi:hypothetical protein
LVVELVRGAAALDKFQNAFHAPDEIGVLYPPRLIGQALAQLARFSRGNGQAAPRRQKFFIAGRPLTPGRDDLGQQGAHGAAEHHQFGHFHRMLDILEHIGVLVGPAVKEDEQPKTQRQAEQECRHGGKGTARFREAGSWPAHALFSNKKDSFSYRPSRRADHSDFARQVEREAFRRPDG